MTALENSEFKIGDLFTVYLDDIPKYDHSIYLGTWIVVSYDELLENYEAEMWDDPWIESDDQTFIGARCLRNNYYDGFQTKDMIKI